MHEISFEKNEEGKLTVSISTEQLHMQSVTAEDLADYTYLLSDLINVAKFADGKPYEPTRTKSRVDAWVKRWNENIPFSSLTVSKNDTDEFVGYVVLGFGELAGSSEIAYVFDKKYWGKGYGKESVTTVVKEYAPEVANRGYKVGDNVFSSVIATSRTDNAASIRILNAAGLKPIKEEVKFEHNRYHFFASIDEILKNKTQPISEEQSTLLQTLHL